MAFVSYREESRKNYGNEDGEINLERLNAGSFFRIADSLEIIAKDKKDLEILLKNAQSDRDYYKEGYFKLKRKISALKGVITKLRNKLR